MPLFPSCSCLMMTNITFAFSPRKCSTFLHLLPSACSLLSSFIPIMCLLLYNCRCLDSMLHAEHKSILEEMRSDYHLIHSADFEAQVVANGKESDLVSNGLLGIEGYQDMDVNVQRPFLFNRALDLRSLLLSLDKNTKKQFDRGTRFGLLQTLPAALCCFSNLFIQMMLLSFQFSHQSHCCHSLPTCFHATSF